MTDDRLAAIRASLRTYASYGGSQDRAVVAELLDEVDRLRQQVAFFEPYGDLICDSIAAEDEARRYRTLGGEP